jgi:hypothetical protein
LRAIAIFVFILVDFQCYDIIPEKNQLIGRKIHFGSRFQSQEEEKEIKGRNWS